MEIATPSPGRTQESSLLPSGCSARYCQLGISKLTPITSWRAPAKAIPDDLRIVALAMGVSASRTGPGPATARDRTGLAPNGTTSPTTATEVLTSPSSATTTNPATTPSPPSTPRQANLVGFISTKCWGVCGSISDLLRRCPNGIARQERPGRAIQHPRGKGRLVPPDVFGRKLLAAHHQLPESRGYFPPGTLQPLQEEKDARVEESTAYRQYRDAGRPYPLPASFSRRTHGSTVEIVRVPPAWTRRNGLHGLRTARGTSSPGGRQSVFSLFPSVRAGPDASPRHFVAPRSGYWWRAPIRSVSRQLLLRSYAPRA